MKGIEPDNEACCALCGRVVSRLTRQHLVPRTLHKRVRTRRNFTRAERHAVILLCCPCHKQIDVVLRNPNSLATMLQSRRLPRIRKSPVSSGGSFASRQQQIFSCVAAA